MTTQIAVRLQNDLVTYIDAEVAAGRANSRAELIGRLLAREVRRQRALGDIEVMKRAGVAGYPDLEGVARATSRRRLDLD